MIFIHKVKNKFVWLFAILVFVVFLYSIFSYSLTDPNLVLSSWHPYWAFQQWMWSTFFVHSQTLTITYSVIVSAWFFIYFLLLQHIQRHASKAYLHRPHLIAFGVIIAVLFFSYNALSHDVFNYIFNAKIVLVYQENPHIVTALDFSDDLWTRFMHNTHTPAPYGYGWTAFSLVPFQLGMGKFLSTWLFFRLFQILALVLLYLVLQKLSQLLFKRKLYVIEAAVLFLNPLFLIEVVSNMHNDLWMMVPALFGIYILLKQRTALSFIVSGALLCLSFSIKFATLVLLPVVMLVLIERALVLKYMSVLIPSTVLRKRLLSWIESLVQQVYARYIPLWCSVLLFLPLFSARSQYFHSWYLLWSICWLPLIRNKWWLIWLLAFSVSSLLRYIPWLLEGGFAEQTLFWQQSITWGVPVIFVFLSLLRRKNNTLVVHS